MISRQLPASWDGSTRRQRRGGAALAAFVVGLPLAAAILCGIHFSPLRETLVGRYFSHPVEWVEIVMFCCALGALGAKLWHWRTERQAFATEVLPPWDGQSIAVTDASRLLAGVNRLSYSLQNSYLVKRVRAILDYLCRRGSAADLDDQMRSLADTDALAQENSFALVRFITWAIPILGFLGTVLGITEAIAGVTPEKLEESLSTVTDGLATAFDTTALALALTMVVMFFTSVVDRAEQAVLESVDAYADRHLAHRFQRTSAEASPLVGVVEQLVQKQAEVWARALDEVNRRQAEAEKRQQQRFTAALEAALEQTLQSHAQRLAALEEVAMDQSSQLLEKLAAVAGAVREQQTGLARIAETMAAQTATLGQLQDGEKHLLRLQELLNQNLTTLAETGAFEQALHSLTAAVHLLTARSGTAPAKSTAAPRPGAAA